MRDNTEEEQTGCLHPSAGIFCDVILEEISAENDRLLDSVDRLQPLLDHVQKVEVVGVTNDTCITHSLERRDDGSFLLTPSAPVKMEVVAAAQLSQGTISKDGSGSDRLAIPIESSHELLLKNVARFCGPGGIGALVAGKSIGMFPANYDRRGVNGSANEAVDVNVTNDDIVKLAFRISDQVTILGEVTDLSNKELVCFKENPTSTFAGYMTSGSFGFPGNKKEDDDDKRRTTFKPTVVVLKVTDALSYTLNVIQRATGCELGLMPKSASDELRHLAIEALGDDNEKNALGLNQLLKSKTDALVGIRQDLMRVDIEHSTGALMFGLDETEAIVDEDGNTVHRYMVPDGEAGSSMAVADIKHSSILLSGVKLNHGDLLQMGRINVSDILLLGDGQVVDGLRIPYASGIEVRGDFNWDEMASDDLERILPEFTFRITSSVSNIFAWAPSFPATFKLELTEIRFSHESVERNRRLAGLDNKTVSNVNDEAPGSGE